jgi:hypothetical protein
VLKKADEAETKEQRARLMNKAVELGEEMNLPMGHQGRLYEMTAAAHFESEHFKTAEKYYLMAINRWVQSGVEPAS